MSLSVDHARWFGWWAHGQIDQRRKYTNSPYMTHPEEVSAIIKSYGGSPVHQIVALLHDTIEDTPVTAEMIEAEFGPKILQFVLDLTDISRPEDGNRKARKAKDLAHLRQASPIAKSVKCADVVSNVSSIVAHDRDFGKVYVREAEAKLTVLTDADLPEMYQRAVECVRNARMLLEAAEMPPGFVGETILFRCS